MRDNVKEFVQLVKTVVTIQEPIIEIGSFQVPEQIGYADLRPLFPGKEYVGCDLQRGPGVDRIENVEHLSLESETIGTILILDTLEHVQNPFAAMDEMYRVLRPGGVLIMSSVMAWPIHEYPNDYWRFTPKCFELLLQHFQTRNVFFQGQKDFPHTVLGLGIKRTMTSTEMEDIAQRLSNATREEIGVTVATPGVCKVVRSGVISSDGAFHSLKKLGVVTKSGYYIPIGKRFPFSLVRAILSKPRTVARLYDRIRLGMMERWVVSHRYDWEGYYSVVKEFKPHRLPKTYVNQIWPEWKKFLDFMARERNPKRILEIGTGRGGSTYFLSKLGGERSLLITIDVDPMSKEYVALFRRYKSQQISCITADSHELTTFQEIAAILDGAPLDLLYIDGDHSYDGVKRDFELYKALCTDKSLICLHDINPDHGVSKGVQTDAYSGEVYRFWGEIKSKYEHAEFIEFPEQDGFGIGVIYYKQAV